MRLSLDLSLSSVVARSARGWSPAMLGASLLAWWTADRSDLITLSGNQVTSWKDVVAGYDAAQAVSAARAIYSATGFNGAPSVSFDGVDDYAECVDAALLAALPINANESDIWGVAQQDALAADTAQRMIAAYGGALGVASRRIGRAVVSAVVRARSGAGDGATVGQATDATVNFNSRHVVRGNFKPTLVGVGIDGSVLTTAAVVPATGALRVRIGAASDTTAIAFWSGKVRDVLLTGPLTTDQAAALTTWALPRRML